MKDYGKIDFLLLRIEYFPHFSLDQEGTTLRRHKNVQQTRSTVYSRKNSFFWDSNTHHNYDFFSYTQQAPSAYMAEMQLTTDERFKLTYEMRVPPIIELLDMSEQTLQKVDGCLLFDFAFDNCTVLYEVIIHQSWFPSQKAKIVTD